MVHTIISQSIKLAFVQSSLRLQQNEFYLIFPHCLKIQYHMSYCFILAKLKGSVNVTVCR